MPYQASLLKLALLVAMPGSAVAADWSGWRGPTGQGQTAETKLPLNWNAKDGTGIVWKAALPGVEAKAALDHNQSSPIVSRGRVFITASFWPGGKPDPKAIPEHHVACYQASDGKRLWDVTVKPGPWLFADLRGGYTAPTPAADGERVYVAFGSAVLAALDYDGKPLWRTEITPYKFDVAFAASPVLYGGTVILQCDQVDKGSRLAAYDARTGVLKWEAARPKVGFGHSTPVVATIGGKAQLLVSASNAIQGADPATGKVIWSCAAKGDTVSPVVGGGLVYCDSGRGGPGFAVDPTGMGDVTKTHLKWKIARVNEGYSSPVVAGDFLYRLQNPEQLKCIRLSTGEEVYSERLGGVTTAASPIATADGLIYVASAGKSYVVKAGPKFDVLAVNDLGDGCPASPAVADGRIFLKGRKWLYCVGSKE